MADIALLVVEEFERRKSLQKEFEGQEVPALTSCFSVLVSGVKEIGLVKEGRVQFEVVKRVLEPKTVVGMAAVNGFFSA